MIQKTIKPKDRQEYINTSRKKLSGRMKMSWGGLQALKSYLRILTKN